MILADLDHSTIMIPVDPGIADIGYDEMTSTLIRCITAPSVIAAISRGNPLLRPSRPSTMPILLWCRGQIRACGLTLWRFYDAALYLSGVFMMPPSVASRMQPQSLIPFFMSRQAFGGV
jgi:hypothetical protein